MSIDQFRRVYPEYDGVDNDVVAEKLRRMFFLEMANDMFAKRFLIDAKEFDSFVLPEWYLKRGDLYVKVGDLRSAEREYDRVSQGFPEWAKHAYTDRNGKRIRTPH
jgi:hypothetical protein